MTKYSVFGDVNHDNKTVDLRIMPDTEFMKLYGDCFTDGYWVGTKTPFILWFTKVSFNDAVSHKNKLEQQYLRTRYSVQA